MPTAAKAAKGGASRARSTAKTPKAVAKPAVKPAAKPAAKPIAKPAAKPAKAPAKPAAGAVAKPKKGPMPKVDPEQRQHYIEVAAYYIAERRGFLGGCEVEDWSQAEREIDDLLREGRLSV